MISRETVDTFTQTAADALARKGVGPDNWREAPEVTRRAYREAVVEAFKAIGVKVEGDE